MTKKHVALSYSFFGGGRGLVVPPVCFHNFLTIDVIQRQLWGHRYVYTVQATHPLPPFITTESDDSILPCLAGNHHGLWIEPLRILNPAPHVSATSAFPEPGALRKCGLHFYAWFQSPKWKRYSQSKYYFHMNISLPIFFTRVKLKTIWELLVDSPIPNFAFPEIHWI